ncbi:MAG: pyruvate kinase, partial [bacterium]
MPFPRTKIVCTLGPSTNTRETLKSLMEAGLSVARLNFSHGTHEQHSKTVALVRATAEELGRPVAILGDLQGPRIRIGDLAEPRRVADGEDITLVAGEDVKGDQFPTTYEDLCNDLKVGDRILIDDGLIELVALEVGTHTVKARVLHGGLIKSHKGMNLPGVAVSAPSITDKDWADVAFAVEHGLEYLALSFVRRAQDIAELREKIPKEMLVVAKIEKDSALENIE